jgi:hypothetical protein
MTSPISPRSRFRVFNLSLGQCVTMMVGVFAVVIVVYLVFGVL